MKSTKYNKLFVTLSVLLMLSNMNNALAAEGQNEVTHNHLRALKTQMENALNTRDIEKKISLITEDAVFTTMNDDRVVGKENIRHYFQKMLGGEDAIVKDVKVKFSVDELSHLYGTNTAVAFGSSQDDYILADGSNFTVKPKWTATMVKQNDQWLVAAFHYSTNMFDNPILKAQRSFFYWIIAIVGIASLISGFLIGKSRQKHG